MIINNIIIRCMSASNKLRRYLFHFLSFTIIETHDALSCFSFSKVIFFYPNVFIYKKT